ncbi:hypothetical protein FGIG_09656 [Fasciola gigantica]|uniref:Uncharacterized protein n=1 Tax=Fasciola gigantica TaxID=46835 RepID=A0A504YYQ6_FASGI|nr:hypothetical protein FGIG_09656 [Fasciola gigantica]
MLLNDAIQPHEKYIVCRVREKGCATKRYSPYYLAYLRSIYSGCTHVLGNLVLCDLERYGRPLFQVLLDTIENGSDPDLSFLSSIQEVSGAHNATVHLYSLVAIKQHNVVLRDNPMLCHLAFTVRWEEIFLDKHNQAAIPDRYHDRISQRGCDPGKVLVLL